MYYFIVNEGARSGKGRLVWKQLEEILEERKTEYICYKTEYAGHAHGLARKICAQPEKEKTIITVGGDGTVNEVLNGITDFSSIRFGVIPVGSGNDYARGLKLDADPRAGLTHLLDTPVCSTIDLGKITWNEGRDSRLFAISAGIGLDAIVCKKALTSRLKKVLNRFHLGKLTYLLLTVQTLFSMDTANAEQTLNGKKSITRKKMIFLAGMNFSAEGGGVPMAPKADPSDGKLDFCMACGIPRFITFLLLPLLVLARHEHIRGFSILRCKNCRLQTDHPMIVHADGEYCGALDDLTFSCLPSVLRVIQ